MAYTRVIIVGGGFGGINAAKHLAKAKLDILVIDRTNHHLFQPLLYQVASASLSPGNIAVPIREILRNYPNIAVIMADVTAIDKDKREVHTADGDAFHYDYLILAPGAKHAYFGHDDWEKNAPGLKTMLDAIVLRERILSSFEKAERLDSFSEIEKYLRFVIVGGGPTGVEMAGAIAEIAHKTLFKNFRKIRPEQSKIYIVEGEKQILPSYPAHLAEIAKKDLEKMDIRVLVNSKVTNVTEEGVWIAETLLEAHNVIWAAGNQAAPVLKTLGVPLDRQGRVIVNPDLTVPNHPEIFVIGDSAHTEDKDGSILPAIAPVAIQQGRYVAKLLKDKASADKRAPFQYWDKGTMATIGRARAVAMVGRLQFSGFIAWSAWALVHILYLISFQHRIYVLMRWIFWYFTGKRQERLIIRPMPDQNEKKLF